MEPKKDKKIINEKEPVMFYRPGNKYGFLSNFYPSEFKIDGKVYKTNEHYFQSQKFEGLPEEQIVINAETPGDAFKLARKYQDLKKKNWFDINEDVMYVGLIQKFKTHPKLREQLLQTGDRYLVQHTKNDKFWGDGGDGSGKNRLGHLLMKLRKEILQSKI